MNKVVSKENALHYIWGEICDGWHLLDNDKLNVIMELVPPGKSEKMHYHNESRQFFFILNGKAVIEIEGQIHDLSANEGIEVEPKQVHQFRNESSEDVTFIVISSPKSHGDRVDVENLS